jgi:hypothetical protein
MKLQNLVNPELWLEVENNAVKLTESQIESDTVFNQRQTMTIMIISVLSLFTVISDLLSVNTSFVMSEVRAACNLIERRLS